MSDQHSSKPARLPVTAAACGLCCDVCTIYIGTHEDPERLARLAASRGWEIEDALCDGCRSARRTAYCRECEFIACTQQRGHAFCNECADYPCPQLEAFQRERPHRAELYQNLERISEVGAEVWLVETKERYSCPACGTLNSTYDLKCRKCGHEPSCEFVATHKDSVLEALRGRM